MFQLLEVVGISKESFSEACKSAIKKISEANEKVYWFEVIEERGGVRNGEVEFQVKLKVAVGVEDTDETALFLCPSCGRAAEKASDLCNPKKVK